MNINATTTRDLCFCPQAAHGQQVFVCERCNKAFKLHKTYKHHMQDHDGVYAKVCSICGKGCKTNHYYKVRHVENKGA